jgi:thiol:disulfide interchange protein DsbC
MSPGDTLGETVDQITMPNPFMQVVQIANLEGVAAISQNGRFAMRGLIYDMWTGKIISSVGELRDALASANLNNLGIPDADIQPMFYGSGPANVTLIVDPMCPFCARLFEQITANPSYAEQYHFKILAVPFLGQPSVEATTVITCHPDRDRALKALMTKDERWFTTARADFTDCPPQATQAMMQRLILSQMLGAQGVPFIVAPNGGISSGLPEDLAAFLRDN